MKEQILLVEDDKDNASLMQLELEYLGYEVTVAGNGAEAVEVAAARPFDLIVMDIYMPKMDGLEAASLIRENPRTKGIPILAATARAMPGDREKCLAGGCNDYIAKPFTHKELGFAVKKLLEKQ